MLYKEEIRFLASLIAAPNLLSKLEGDVSSNDFRNKNYYIIYEVIIDCLINGNVISYKELKFKFKNNLLCAKIIDEIESEELITTDINLVYNEMLEQAQHQQLKETANSFVKQVNNPSNTVLDLISSIESKLTNIRMNSNVHIESVSNFATEVSASITARHAGYQNSGKFVADISTGLDILDEQTYGFAKKNMWLLAAATSDGKTQLAVQFAHAVLSNKHMVYWFQCEDSKTNLIERFLSLRNRIKIKDIKTGAITKKQLEILQKDLIKIRQENKLLVDEETNEINDIVSKVKLAKIKYPTLSLIVVDYIGLLMDGSKIFSNREQEISFISKKLIALSKAADVAILTLAQLNTNPDDRSRGVPIRMNDLRDSKAPGHDASVALFVNHPLKYGYKDSQGVRGTKTAKEAWATSNPKKYSHLIIAKNRYGEVGKIIELSNFAEIARFDEGKPKNCMFEVRDFL